MDTNRRKHCDLRMLVDKACEGLAGGTRDRIKDVARRAYYLGARDGIELAREKEKVTP